MVYTWLVIFLADAAAHMPGRQLDNNLVMCRLVSGTSLVAVVSTALASSYTYLSHGVVDTAAALLIASCAIVTAPLGANLTTTLNAAVSYLQACMHGQGTALAGQQKSAAHLVAGFAPGTAMAAAKLTSMPSVTGISCALAQPHSLMSWGRRNSGMLK